MSVVARTRRTDCNLVLSGLARVYRSCRTSGTRKQTDDPLALWNANAAWYSESARRGIRLFSHATTRLKTMKLALLGIDDLTLAIVRRALETGLHEVVLLTEEDLTGANRIRCGSFA